MTLRFDHGEHGYYLDGVRIPSVTQMLHAEGLIDTTWFTEEGRIRGTAVHDLTAAYDLGSMDRTDVERYDGRYRPWLLAHAEGMDVLKPEVLHVEEPWAHVALRFGVRLDRLLKLWSALSILEVKTGPPAKWHAIQTALQAIVAEQETGVPATSIRRYGWYLNAKGKYKLEEFTHVADIGKARQIIRRQAVRQTAWVPEERW